MLSFAIIAGLLTGFSIFSGMGLGMAVNPDYEPPSLAGAYESATGQAGRTESQKAVRHGGQDCQWRSAAK